MDEDRRCNSANPKPSSDALVSQPNESWANGVGWVRRLIGISVLLLLLVCIAISFLPARCATRDVGPDESCRRRLQSIHEGLVGSNANYPQCAPYIVGPNGDKHSWRISVMQYLERRSENSPLKGYRFDQPWDSPHNREVVQQRGLHLFLRCRLEEGSRRDYPYTSYLLLVRPESGRTAQTLSPKAVIVVESANCGVEYFEPKDLPWDSLWEGSSPFGLGKLHSLHPTIVRALCVDGTIIEIPRNLDTAKLRAVLDGTATLRSKWWNVVAVIGMTFLGCVAAVYVSYTVKELWWSGCEE